MMQKVYVVTMFALIGFARCIRQDMAAKQDSMKNANFQAGTDRSTSERIAHSSAIEKFANIDDDADKSATLAKDLGTKTLQEPGGYVDCKACIKTGRVWENSVCKGQCQNTEKSRCYTTESGCDGYEHGRSIVDYACAFARTCTECLKAHYLCMWDGKQSQCYSESYLNTRVFSEDDIVSKDHRHCIDSTACLKDTGGSCMVKGCKSFRNATCTDGRCTCSHDQCSRFGKCFAKDDCPYRTGGTCNPFVCAKSRNAHCVDGECVCFDGTCAFEGKCWTKKQLEIATNDVDAVKAVSDSETE